MSFTLPTFNITCNVWSNGVNPLANPPRATFPCNLAFGRRVQNNPTAGGIPGIRMTLLLPVGTDIRSQFNASGYDTVEVPAGSGRLYWVQGVDDIGKGFPNEHRAALIYATSGYGFWPTPTP